MTDNSYIRAYEVGQTPTSAKYDLAVRLKTLKNGPTVRNRLKLPFVVNTSMRVCVICPPDSAIARQAQAAGASLIGEETVFETIKAGKLDFERCICHTDSAVKMNAAGLGRILGPRGMMPNVKLGTVTKDVEGTVKKLVGASEYRERMGVVRCAVGQLGFSPEQLQVNIKAFMDGIKRDINGLTEKISKDIHEVVSHRRFSSMY